GARRPEGAASTAVAAPTPGSGSLAVGTFDRTCAWFLSAPTLTDPIAGAAVWCRAGFPRSSPARMLSATRCADVSGAVSYLTRLHCLLSATNIRVRWKPRYHASRGGRMKRGQLVLLVGKTLTPTRTPRTPRP